MDKHPNTIGKRIAKLRLAHAMTQERLAREMDVSPQAVSKWENDLNYPDVASLPKLARLLDTTVDELLTGEAPNIATHTSRPKDVGSPDEDTANPSKAENAAHPVNADEAPPTPAAIIPHAPKRTGLRSLFKRRTTDPNTADVSGADRTGAIADARCLRIVVHDPERDGDHADVNLRVPISLVKAGVSFGLKAVTAPSATIPPEAQRFLEGLDAETLIGVIASGERGTIVDVQDGETFVRIAIE